MLVIEDVVGELGDTLFEEPVVGIGVGERNLVLVGFHFVVVDGVLGLDHLRRVVLGRYFCAPGADFLLIGQILDARSFIDFDRLISSPATWS